MYMYDISTLTTYIVTFRNIQYLISDTQKTDILDVFSVGESEGSWFTIFQVFLVLIRFM